MKKTYLAPVIKAVAVQQKYHLLSASDPVNRNVAGGPTKNSLPTDISEGFNPDYLTGGQNGNSIRSREIDWDF